MSIGGRNTTFQHGTNGNESVLTDFTGKIRNLGLPREAEEVDATVFGNTDRQYEQAFKNATIPATYKYDDTTFTQLQAIFDGGVNVDFELGPDGDDNGKPKVTGAMFLKQCDLSMGIGSLMEITATWRVDGTPTVGVFS